jgi:hypothetical protein
MCKGLNKDIKNASAQYTINPIHITLTLSGRRAFIMTSCCEPQQQASETISLNLTNKSSFFGHLTMSANQ